MNVQCFRAELTDFYWNRIDGMADEFRDRMFELLDNACTPDMSGYQRKALQYKMIANACCPVLLHQSPFYHELGTMSKLCDGAGSFHGKIHAGAWNERHSAHLYSELAPELKDLRDRQSSERLYLICGMFCDAHQHFIFNCVPLLEVGAKGLYEKAQRQLKTARDDEEKDFLSATMTGLLSLKTISEKFSARAEEMLRDCVDADERARLTCIRDAASHTPWEAPRTFYEALNLLAFMRTVVGALEGVGFNTFGRPDVSLYPFYEKDIADGTLTKAEAYELVKAFLLTWDCHYDHDMLMSGYADHELENTYTLGGCDAQGNPVWNDLTEFFIRATREEKIIFPKITIRYSANSPKEYLDAADMDVIKGTSAVLYQNDDSSIPALYRAGRTLEEARDYLVTGCWQMLTNGNMRSENGNYVNLLKCFEMAIHNRRDAMERCELPLEIYDDAQDFEDVYRITIENCRRLFRARNRITLEGKPLWHLVDPLPLNSASLIGCLESCKDLTNGGCKYHDEEYDLVGFPNIVDSLLVMKKLCFDQKVCSLRDLLDVVRDNWEGNELLRKQALRCPCWGDESEESCALASRFNHDLYEALSELRTLWPGGRINMGHLTYTEIRFWAEKTLATPDGRRNGEYFSQGLSPSRLHKISSVTSVVNSFARLDASEMAANAVVNIILPSSRMTLDNCEAFLRATAHTALQCMQLNCVTKEELLDAQIHPENHQNLIIRVCGFSARFTSLSPEWQKEVLSRNFYD